MNVCIEGAFVALNAFTILARQWLEYKTKAKVYGLTTNMNGIHTENVCVMTVKKVS